MRDHPTYHRLGHIVCPLCGRTLRGDMSVERMRIATRKNSSILQALRVFLDLSGTN